MRVNVVCVALVIVLFFMYGCATTIINESIPSSINTYPPKDHFERVYVNDVGVTIRPSDATSMDKVGSIRIQDWGGKQTLIQKAMSECRRMGGNWIVIESYRENAPGMSWGPYRPSLLTATAYIRLLREGEQYVGQLLQRGPTEAELKDVWAQSQTLPYEGIYQSIDADNSYKLKVGFQKQSNGRFNMLYLSGMGAVRSWSEGDVIGVFEQTAIQGVFLGDWVNLDKYTTSAELVFQNSGSFSVSYIPWNQRVKTEFNYIRTFPIDTVLSEPSYSSSTGTGFLLSPKGYIVTCHHVIKDARNIYVIDNDRSKTRLSASVVVTDTNNDLCILKVNGLSFGTGNDLSYGFDSGLNRTGESVFCMGFPLTQVMGNEIKVTNGIISSVTGYRGDVSSYQVSTPVQPGNSGGPLFNSYGNVIGVVNAKITQAENVSYAVKTSYLMNLIGLLPDEVILSKKDIGSISLSAMVERFRSAVYMIEAGD